MGDLEKTTVYSQKSEFSQKLLPCGIMFPDGPESVSLKDRFHCVVSRIIQQGDQVHISRNLRQSRLAEAQEN